MNTQPDELSTLPGVQLVKLTPKTDSHHAQLFIVVAANSFADKFFSAFAEQSGSSLSSGGYWLNNYTFSLVPAYGVPTGVSTPESQPVHINTHPTEPLNCVCGHPVSGHNKSVGCTEVIDGKRCMCWRHKPNTCGCGHLIGEHGPKGCNGVTKYDHCQCMRTYEQLKGTTT